jgi:hypothetical protein
MAGDEVLLRFEMLDAARGKVPRSDAWKKPQGTDSYFSGAGSQNIWLMRFATQALRGQEVPLAEAVYNYQLGPPPGSTLVGRGGAVLTTTEPLATDKVYAPGFGGSEFLSTIYWGWHLLSHLALIRKGGDIGAKARRWVVLNWVLFRAIQAPNGSLMLFGQRSAGHNPKPREVDWLFARASDGDVARAEKWCKEAGAGLKRGFEFEIGNELISEMRQTWQESLAIKETDLPGLFPVRVPTEIIRTTEGVAVVHATNCNPNTPPILAGVCTQDGRRDIFPTSDVKGVKVPGGIRIRQRFDQATARIDGSEIVYTSALFTGGAEQRITLPGGDLIYHLKLGTGAVAPVPVTEPEPEPVDPGTEPEPEPPFPDLANAADLIENLTVRKQKKNDKAQIVAQLRSGDLDDDALDNLIARVRDLGIGEGQEQADRWRQAIAILEGVG